MKRTYIENLDYKDLQKKCKELKLTAVGTKSILKNRLIEYFDKQVDDIDDMISSLNNITLEEHDFLYHEYEVIPIFELGILIKNYLYLNNMELYPTKILQEYNNNNPNCILEDNRKILLINTIIYMFEFYKKTSTNSNILEELIENGYNVCKQIYPNYTY